HPLRVEVVAWASCQAYLPSALFAMLSILAYLRTDRTGGRHTRAWRAASVVLFGIAVLFKPVPLCLPAVLLILDVYPLGRLRGRLHRDWWAVLARLVLQKVPYLVISGACLAVTFHARSDLLSAHADGSAARALFASYSTIFYLHKTLLPTGLCHLYPAPASLRWNETAYLGSALLAILLTALCCLARRRWPGLLAAWLAYLVILVPNAGLTRYALYVVADRYSYFTFLGLAAGAGVLFAVLIRQAAA